MAIQRDYYRFAIGQRVIRPVDVYNKNSPLRHGKIIYVYDSTYYNSDPDLSDWYYPELYDVRWDDGKIGRGYLRHGLNQESSIVKK